MIFATGLTGTIGRKCATFATPLAIKYFEETNSILHEHLKTSDFVGSTWIHLAGFTNQELINKNPLYSRRVNTDFPLLVASEAIKLGVKRFIFVSTGHVYATSSSPISEEDQTDPQSVYATHKLDAEFAIKELLRGSGIEVVIARIFSILDLEGQIHTLGGAIREILSNPKTDRRILSSLDVRDFQTSETVSLQLFDIARSLEYFPIVNICSGHAISVKDAVTKICSDSNIRIEEFLELKYSKLPFLVGNPHKLQIVIDSLSHSK